MNTPERILVIGPSWVGDMIMAQSLFMSLRSSSPNCRIDVLAPSWSLPLLERMPEVAKAITMPLKHGQFGLSTRYRLGRQLRSEHYDRTIVMTSSWKSALIPFFANIPVRTGYVGECRWGILNDLRYLDKEKLIKVVERFVTLGLPKNTPLPPSYQNPSLPIKKSDQQAVIQKFNLTLPDKILVLCPGAEAGPSKRWPPSYFAEIAKTKIQQGWKIWLMGTEKEKSAADIINQATQHQCKSFIGLTSLTEAIDLISLAHKVVANDSGLMHIAAALDKQVIAIYGSTPPEFAPPLCDKGQSAFSILPCAPCRQGICPLYPIDHPEHTKCLTGIKPERILELLAD